MEKQRAFGDGTLLDKIFENWDKISEIFACFTAGLSQESLALQIQDGVVKPKLLRRLRRRLRKPSRAAIAGTAEIMKSAEGGGRKKWRKRLKRRADRLTNSECDQILSKWATTVLEPIG